MSQNQPKSAEEPVEECPNVLLSIEPEHADAILSGEKLWEYRRVAPARGPMLRLVLYASSPEQAAVGTAWCHKVKEDDPETLVDETLRSTPHTREEVLEYFDGADTGYALRIGAFHRFDDAVPRERLATAGHEPAQNFRYLGAVRNDPQRVDSRAVIPGLTGRDA